MPGETFEDTHLFEPDEVEYFDTAEKIMALSDALSEELILDSIRRTTSGST